MKSLSSVRSWRNWQTHQLEGLAVAIPWWFESTRPHHLLCEQIQTTSGPVLQAHPSQMVDVAGERRVPFQSSERLLAYRKEYRRGGFPGNSWILLSWSQASRRSFSIRHLTSFLALFTEQ